MIDHWLELVRTVAYTPTLVQTGVRKVVQDIRWDIPGDSLSHDLTYTDLNYRGSKHQQLLRTYWNQSAVDDAVAKLIARKSAVHTSVAIPLTNMEKKKTSQGHCMQTMVITKLGTGYCSVDIYYRSTELIQKFLADMVFFSLMLPKVFAAAGVSPQIIRFKFSNVYLSAVFAPIWIRYETNLDEFFNRLETEDPAFFRRFGLSTRRLLRDNHNYGYRTQAAMFEYHMKYRTKAKDLELRRILGKIDGGMPMEER